MASRRKRGPVAFRPRLLAGLAFSLQLLSIVEDRLRCRIFNFIGTYSSDGNIRFGSLAPLQDDISLMSASGGKADVFRFNFGSLGLNIRLVTPLQIKRGMSAFGCGH